MEKMNCDNFYLSLYFLSKILHHSNSEIPNDKKITQSKNYSTEYYKMRVEYLLVKRSKYLNLLLDAVISAYT